MVKCRLLRWEPWYDRMTIRFGKTESVTIQFERINGICFW